ncbi:hypothetical protein SNOG_06597 [Parastagonospora nodorum SN15]|uniref:Uncharacterized protein n=1 Tax=Phaeosphaeria nodorum (strain SN15 / ATCC MYA-4574 / FGSC 10173) TaxID=321614 RepID=Q0UNR7_PHANO|nr:hypothetical protein SNOG_06597 [Parastagonospora nodorum SN15]EAT86428.1 hypothetical protein SNOG_06597 [Parastagonospora nodorum SN15]
MAMSHYAPYTKSHGDWFVRKWAELRLELEQYLGGNIRVRNLRGLSNYDARFAALAKEESKTVPKQPDQESIGAIENWKKAVADKWRPLIAEKAADKEVTAVRWDFEFSTSGPSDNNKIVEIVKTAREMCIVQ